MKPGHTRDSRSRKAGEDAGWVKRLGTGSSGWAFVVRAMSGYFLRQADCQALSCLMHSPILIIPSHGTLKPRKTKRKRKNVKRSL
jgi:hypothetical protein